MKTIGGSILTICAAGLLLGGCTLLHSDYERPELDEYAFANGAAPAGGSFAAGITDSYWERYADPDLTALIEEVLRSGDDYYQALIRVKQARVNADVAGADLLPDFDASLNAGLSKAFEPGRTSRSSGSSLQVSYEADLFGRLSAADKSAAYALEAAEYDARAARLTVSYAAANLYWDIVFCRDAVALYESNLRDSAETLAIMRNRFEAGDVSELELVQAESDLIGVRKTLEEYRVRLGNDVASVNMLRNRTPDAGVATAASLADLAVPEPRAGLGSELLAIRPDVAAAEARVKAALSAKDAARLDMYPRFSLTGSVGGSSDELAKFFDNPVGSIIARLALPFVNFYRNSLQIDLAELSRDSAEMSFVTAYYRALGEVYRALANVSLDRTLLDADRRALELSQKSEDIYRRRYEAGSVALKDYLDARAARRSAALELFSRKRVALDDAAVFAKAVGGL